MYCWRAKQAAAARLGRETACSGVASNNRLATSSIGQPLQNSAPHSDFHAVTVRVETMFNVSIWLVRNPKQCSECCLATDFARLAASLRRLSRVPKTAERDSHDVAKQYLEAHSGIWTKQD
jgi:hypothetical protein